MSYFYGPVPSRRLGFSLGVNLLPKKACSFDCIYCQLGRTSRKTLKRFTYVKLDRLKKELKGIIKRNPRIDYITISGCGEPTLHKHLDKIILAIKKITRNKYPVCVITNSSLLCRDEVRKELAKVDLIIPSLDTVSPRIFKKIDRPHKKIALERIVEGLLKLKKEFKGKIWLEIMLIGNINDTIAEAKKFKEIIQKINPEKVQLNLPIRPSGTKIILPQFSKVKKLAKIIGPRAQVVSQFYKKAQKKFSESIKNDIMNFLKVRPATLKDLTSSLGISQREMFNYLKGLLVTKKIKCTISHKEKYFSIRND
jgi:wyosine [tRNA(Phe)-imidazoG37] synthetase (radical SAM superfamily)